MSTPAADAPAAPAELPRLSPSRAASLGLFAGTLAMLGPALVLNGLLPGATVISLWLAATAALGAIIVWRAGSPLGWLLQGAIIVGALGNLAEEIAAAAVAAGRIGPGAVAAAWVAHWVRIPPMGSLVALFLLFPTARLPSRRWRFVAGAAALGLALGTISVALMPGPMEGQPAIDNPFGIAGAAGVLGVLEDVGAAGLAVGALAALASLVVRMRRASGDERQQVKWLLYAGLLLLVTVLFALVTEGPLNELSFVAVLCGLFAVPAALTVALTKYRLYDVDLFINRTIVYTGLTTAVIVLYILIVGVMGALLQQRVGLLPALLATGIVAVAFQPLRRSLQDAVNRVMYGDRRNPYGAVTGLAARLEATIDPGDVLPTIVETVARSLKLEYVAIEVDRADRQRVVTSTGRHSHGDLAAVPIVYQGRDVGRLVVGVRSGDTLTATDLALLADLARSAGAAVHAVALTDALRRSRNDLLAAREEERRRLRRDLHDGLGPELAGIALGIGAARNLAVQDPGAVGELLERLRAQAEDAARSVRGLVEGLRPAALDDLGLVETVRQKATAMLSGAGIELRMSAPEDSGQLPAAVETAALRIALEAVTNVVRHSQARRCDITVAVDKALILEIRDDGRGLAGSRGGVGMVSMRERAEEVGGTVVVTPSSGGGTVVRAVLPLA